MRPGNERIVSRSIDSLIADTTCIPTTRGSLVMSNMLLKQRAWLAKCPWKNSRWVCGNRDAKCRNASTQLFNRENVKEGGTFMKSKVEIGSRRAFPFSAKLRTNGRQFQSVLNISARFFPCSFRSTTQPDATRRDFALNSKQRRRFRLVADTAFNWSIGVSIVSSERNQFGTNKRRVQHTFHFLDKI